MGPIPQSLSLRARRALGNASSGSSTVHEQRWRRERDELADLLEPAAQTDLTEGERRRVVDLLSESAPSPDSRMTQAEWDDEVGAIVAELVSRL